MKLSKQLPVTVFAVIALAIGVFFLRFVIGGSEDGWLCENNIWVKHGNPRADKPTEGCGELIGGQKDEHGCLGPAGYSWCEIKQKCLRVWEEPCEIAPEAKPQDVLSYINTTLDFSLELPKTWEGYKATEGQYPNYSYTGFSFGGEDRQPFTIFQILSYTKLQWDAVKNKTAVTILDQTAEAVLVCDGCCTTAGDSTGGGQFDDFQIARCKEVPAIIETFKKL